MTKKDLMNGDIVVLRSGLVGVVIMNGDTSYLMFQNEGWEDLDIYYDDEMIYTESNPNEEDAIMQVYRTNYGFSFSDYTDNEPIYERDGSWIKPTKEEMVSKAAERKAKYETQMVESRKQIEEARKDLIYIVAQQFYGNRTATEIRRDEVDYFLQGMPSLPKAKPVDRRVVKVPNSDHVVIVYDQNQEDEYVNIEFPEFYAKECAEYQEHTGKELTMHVSCEIPELNFKIHTRCFACRIDHDGVFQSLADGDGKFVTKYFA